MHQAVSDLTATAQEKEKGKAMLSSIDLTNKENISPLVEYVKLN